MDQKLLNIDLNQQNSNLVGELRSKDSAIHDLRMREVYSNNGKKDKARASTLEKELADKDLDVQIAQNEAAALRAIVAEKEALILEWMHSNEAFRKLARQYGQELGVTDEKLTDDYRHTVVDVAEEDPKFASTNLVDRVKKNLAK